MALRRFESRTQIEHHRYPTNPNIATPLLMIQSWMQIETCARFGFKFDFRSIYIYTYLCAYQYFGSIHWRRLANFKKHCEHFTICDGFHQAQSTNTHTWRQTCRTRVKEQSGATAGTSLPTGQTVRLRWWFSGLLLQGLSFVIL